MKSLLKHLLNEIWPTIPLRYSAKLLKISFNDINFKPSLKTRCNNRCHSIFFRCCKSVKSESNSSFENSLSNDNVINDNLI